MLHRRQFLASAAALTAPVALAAPRAESLDPIARTRGLRFGTAVAAEQLADARLAQIVRDECSVLVAENEFKWKHAEPRRGGYNFKGADTIAAFARANGMALRGHTLCWNQDNRIPNWLLAMEPDLGSGSASKTAELMAGFIRTMTARYPQVASWDAVNEAVNLSDGKLRDSVLTRTLGSGFIDIAVALAREAAPKAQIVYNDYMSWDAKPDHRRGVIEMLEAAAKRGVTFDALGVQSHLGPNFGKPRDEKGWRDFLTAIEAMGMDILITELDCSDRNVAAADPATRDAETAAYVKGYLDLTLSFRRVKQVVLWQVTDRDTYLNRPAYPQERRRPDGLAMRGHPWDADLKPKSMRAAIAAALKAAPAR